MVKPHVFRVEERQTNGQWVEVFSTDDRKAAQHYAETRRNDNYFTVGPEVYPIRVIQILE